MAKPEAKPYLFRPIAERDDWGLNPNPCRPAVCLMTGKMVRYTEPPSSYNSNKAFPPLLPFLSYIQSRSTIPTVLPYGDQQMARPFKEAAWPLLAWPVTSKFPPFPLPGG